MSNGKIEPYYQKRAESIVDMLFDSKLFNERLTRKDLQAIEDFIASEFQAGVDGAIKIKEILGTSDLHKGEER